MSFEPAITLFDIPSTLNSKPWSPNTWKARIVLNYKRIPYKTVWVSYPDIQSTLKSLGGSLPMITDPEGNPHYTLPAILDSNNGTPILITDSLKIAEYLDTKYPQRPVFPKDGKALQYAFEETFNRIIGRQFLRMILPLSWGILDERTKMYFHDTKKRWQGNTKYPGPLRPDGSVTERDWELLKHGFDTLAIFLDKNGPEGTYIAGGTEPTRADMIIISFLASIVAAAPQQWDRRIKHWNGGRWEILWRASQSWRAVH